MNWYTDRSRAAPAASARPWLPRTLAATVDASRPDVPSAAPLLAFDESEMARIAAAMSLRARHDARAACAADPASRLARALEHIAAALADAGRRQAGDDTAAMRRTIEVAAAIARAAGPLAGDTPALADRIGAMLTGSDGPLTARLVVTPEVAEDLRPLLPAIAARAGFAGSLELEADPRLPEGAVQLLWPGGWLEHDPAALAARVAELLAAHDPQPSPAATDGADHDPEPS